MHNDLGLVVLLGFSRTEVDSLYERLYPESKKLGYFSTWSGPERTGVQAVALLVRRQLAED